MGCPEDIRKGGGMERSPALPIPGVRIPGFHKHICITQGFPAPVNNTDEGELGLLFTKNFICLFPNHLSKRVPDTYKF